MLNKPIKKVLQTITRTRETVAPAPEPEPLTIPPPRVTTLFHPGKKPSLWQRLNTWMLWTI